MANGPTDLQHVIKLQILPDVVRSRFAVALLLA